MKYSLILLLLFPFCSFAETAQLAGTIQDSTKKQPIELATIVLKRIPEMTIYKGIKSDLQGRFEFKNIAFGNYALSITAVGYQTKVIAELNVQQKVIDLKQILLLPSSNTLAEALIIAEKKDIEVTAEKKSFNVDKNATSAGGTAADALRNVPSVNVDMDGNVSIRGKSNVTILVDGKQNSLFENDPVTALQALPASSIETIEVITNPSSKYDAQGMNGIINIILKKDRKPGWNGMVTLGVGSPFRLNGGLVMNANVKKWNFFLNANSRTSRNWEETTNNRNNYENDLTYSSFTRNDRTPLNGFVSAGFDYNINKRNKITLTQNLFNARMKGDSRTTIENERNFSSLVNYTTRRNQYVGSPLSPSTNLQYKHFFKNPKKELSAELNFSKTRYIRKSEFETLVFDSLSNITTGFNQTNPVRGGNWNGTAQLDYTQPAFKNGRWDLGMKNYIIQFKSENQPTIQYLNQPEYAEPILKNKFRFTQQVHSIYSNVANQYGKIGVQAGLRAEYFNYDGFAYQYNAGAKDEYISLFPTAFISYKKDEKQDFTWNYARRVNRPNFFQLIPFLDVTNPQDTSQGNPNLRPEFIHATELGYTNQYNRNSTFLASVYFQYTNNLIQRFRRFNADGTTYSQNRNLASARTFGLELTNKTNILSWWDVTANVNVFRNQLEGGNVDAGLNRNGFGGFAKLNTNARFIHNWSAQITANYFAPTVVAQGEVKGYGNVDLALKKQLFKKSLTLTLNANDIFNTRQTETWYYLYPSYNQTVLRKNLTRTFGLNLQWKFASKSQRNNLDAVKARPTKKEKEKEAKSRDENLKKDEGGDDMNSGGGNRSDR
jgi:iron complex outermembrane receptor protein